MARVPSVVESPVRDRFLYVKMPGQVTNGGSDFAARGEG
eukprot:CAMPEP_0171809878 /NCGR_PEP_ID=MMETSP0991-20121206/77196_1 /TAXON_ID=483369 /ORGANISM="non described non described, Strain CCMP2098" /LENGTH=38 /DNA_ID= /DNA_START= /DNA_END= /DNA_ORIENTATION=